MIWPSFLVSGGEWEAPVDFQEPIPARNLVENHFGTFIGDEGRVLTGINDVFNCRVADVTFLDTAESRIIDRISPGSIVGPRVRLGPGSTVHANAVIHHDVSIGCGVTIHSGAVIGSNGFYYTRAPRRLFPMIGTVVVEDEVDIGANTVVDRAATNVTRIGKRTKVDNLVHIGHDVKIGADCTIQAHAAIHGQVTVHDRVTIRGMAGVVDHVVVGAGTDILPLSGLTTATPNSGRFVGMPAVDVERFARAQANQKLVSTYLEEMRRLRGFLYAVGIMLYEMITGLHRERIVHVRLDSVEGGLNLNMPAERVAKLMAYGKLAGEKLRDDFNWDEHRWKRFLV